MKLPVVVAVAEAALELLRERHQAVEAVEVVLRLQDSSSRHLT